jgi:hypothetical protein
MSTDAERQRYAEELARDWADKGRLVEGGWRAMRQLLLRNMDHLTSEDFEASARKIFFLGAEHVFMSIIGFMEAGHEPTDADMRRMSALHEELAAFRKSLASHHTKAGNA